MNKLYFFASLSFIFLNCHPVKNTSSSNQGSYPNWALLPFIKADAANPVLAPDTTLVFTDPVSNKKIRWTEKDVFNPATVVKGDTLFLLIRAQDNKGTSRVGLSYSLDGLHFTTFPSPVLYPDNDDAKQWEWPGGCEDPRVVQDASGTYYMTYTGYDGTAARLLVATSTDLRHWIKRGPAFATGNNGKYKDFWSKSGSIVSTYKGGKITAAKINNKYWMYWGDQNIWAATSDDLINWSPVETKDTSNRAPELQRGIAKNAAGLKVVFGPQPKKFDSDLVESGPPAMLTDKGILLIYNSRNIPAIGDASLPEGTYAGAQILMDKNDPTKVLSRMENYFIKPDKNYEITGQVNNVCFLEGLAQYKGKWFLYYGTADSKIAVAIK